MAQLTTESYDIFISYRRSGSFETANLIADRLKNAGYRVFFDVESLKSGKFNERLYAVIEQCTDFILVLPENGLDRCDDQEDWVRLEILHALRHGKNIIPVMLRGFEFPQVMPKGMEELKNFNAVTANSHEYFDASIVRLRSFLKSKRGITWRKYKMQFFSIVAVLAILSCFFGYFKYQDQKHLESICGRETLLMGFEFGKMHVALTEASNAKEEWEKYLVKFASASPQDTAFMRKQFIDLINHKINNLPTVQVNTLTDESSTVLSKKGIKTEEIVAFYTALCPSYFKEVYDYLNNLKIYARMPFVSETISKNARLSHDALVENLKGNYYAYLGFLTTMPKAVYSDDFYKIRSELSLLSEIPVNKTLKEYESDQDVSFRKYEKIVLEMGQGLNNESLNVEGLQHDLDQRKKEFQNVYLSKETVKLNEKKLGLDEKRAELAKKQTDLDEMYKRLLVKCTFTADEDQWMMWGKILRLSTATRNSLRLRKEEKAQMEINRQEAIRKGVDPSNLSEPTYLVSLDDMFSEIYKRIDLFEEYNQAKDPLVNEYAPVAKQYFKSLRAGEIEDLGILMIGTENNVVHPVFKVGDIVIERKGKPIRYVDEFFKLKEDPAPNVEKIIRFSADGKKNVRTETVPDTKIMVGFVNLRETE